MPEPHRHKAIETYHRPGTLAEALELMAGEPGARFVAGRTDLMVRIRDGSLRPASLVSLRNIPELSGVTLGDDGARIGAATPIGDLATDAGLMSSYRVLVEAARALGSVQIRNAATIGGNLCNASPCADTAPPLLVTEATVRIVGPDGERELPIEEFFTGPGLTRLGRDEILAEIKIPPQAPGVRATFLKKGRVAMDLSQVSVAVLLDSDGGSCVRARVAAGSVAPRPIRLREVEAVLEGGALDDARIARAREVAQGEVQPITDVRATAEYRRHMSGVLVQRAVEALTREGTE